MESIQNLHLQWRLRCLLSLLAALLQTAVMAAEFNNQVMARVKERLDDFMTSPVRAASRIARFRETGGFPHNMEAPDRDTVLHNFFVEIPTILYYALEDGMDMIYSEDWTFVYYREPGDSGYDGSNVPPEMEKYWNACVDSETGEPQNCVLSVGDYYTKCVNNCELIPCPDEDSQKDCNTLSGEEKRDCEANIKWCKNYEIKEVMDGDFLGYVPEVSACIDKNGQMTQTPGNVLLNFETGEMGNCYFGDGKTMVNRTLDGNFEYCKVDNHESNSCSSLRCEDSYVGTFDASNYDARYRDWYIATKTSQRPSWSDPYPFWDLNTMGITYSEPIFSTENSKKVFKGVIAVDYTLSKITDFLATQYSGDDMNILIAEYEEPHYVIASSTGSSSNKLVLKSDMITPCPDSESEECDVARVSITEMQDDPMDIVLARAFLVHKDNNFPTQELLSLKESDNVGAKAYVSQGQSYEQENAVNLRWQIVVVMPMAKSSHDAALPGQSVFVITCVLGGLGFFGCLVLFKLFYLRRKEKAVINADWRFTCSFIAGCAALNLSTFTLLGENEDETCMLRMWSFNGLFVSALSPLFVKVWRMYTLLNASSGFQRVNVTHLQAVFYTLPLIFSELVLLTIFSFVDPPRQVEQLGVGDGYGEQVIRCEHQTHAFFFTQLVFDACLVFLGCILAYRTRDLDPKFGEAKQLGFSMYNIAFTGLVVVAIVKFVDLDQSNKIVLQAVGVLWGSFFCSLAFVLPRLLEVQKDKKSRHATRNFRPTMSGRHNVLVSGLDLGLSGHSTTDAFYNSPNNDSTRNFQVIDEFMRKSVVSDDNEGSESSFFADPRSAKETAESGDSAKDTAKEMMAALARLDAQMRDPVKCKDLENGPVLSIEEEIAQAELDEQIATERKNVSINNGSEEFPETSTSAQQQACNERATETPETIPMDVVSLEEGIPEITPNGVAYSKDTVPANREGLELYEGPSDEMRINRDNLMKHLVR